MDVKSRTLNRWQKDLPPGDIGRPPQAVERDQRIILRDEIDRHGTNLEHLKHPFPIISRKSLAEFMVFYLLAQNRLENPVPLTWEKPGTVWAIDCLSRDVEKNYDTILNVRDLSSGKTLAGRAMRIQPGCKSAQTAENVELVLAELFHLHGAPLVIKSDNGSEFVNEVITRLMARYGTTHLLSPAYFPEYNGACEAGGGALMTRALEVAATVGQPGILTIDALETGRKVGNSVPRRGGRSSANSEWLSRQPISDTERKDFQQSVREKSHSTREEFWAAEGYSITEQLSKEFIAKDNGRELPEHQPSGGEAVEPKSCYGQSTWNEEENVGPGGEIEGLDVEKDFSTWIEKNRDISKNKKVVIEFLVKCDRVGIERALSGAGILLTRRG